jgi:hypothetical protein
MMLKILSLITGSLFGQLRQAYQAKLQAENETERLVADVAIKDIERQIEDRRAAKEIRLATVTFPEIRLLSFLAALPFIAHANAVGMDTIFKLGWRIPAFPAPFDEWQGRIILSFFGLQAGLTGISAIASAIRGRK